MLKIVRSLILFTCITFVCFEVDAQLVGYSRLYTVESHLEYNNGFSTNSAGDFNGDGTIDFVVGEVFDNFGQSNENHASVFSGATGELIHYFGGFSYGTFFGDSVSGAGDVNADGRDDIIVAIPGGFFNEQGVVIGARIYSGMSQQILYDIPQSDVLYNQQGLGRVRAAGDLNGDGYDDVAIRDYSNTRFYSGINGQPLFDLPGREPLDGMTIDDLDGDNLDELIVGSYEEAVLVSSNDGSVLFSFEGFPKIGPINIGDVNLDGIEDRISGDRFARAPRGGGAFETTGAVNIISGKDDSHLFTYYGYQEGDDFGSYIATLGDINSDGVVDFIAGAPSDLDRSYVYAYVSIVVPEPYSLTLLCLATSGLLLKRRS